MRKIVTSSLIAIVATVIATVPAAAASAPATPLTGLEPGLWQLRVEGQPPRALCIGDPRGLLQLRHAATGCSRMVIAREGASTTVHYSCPGAGWGRTTVRTIGARAARIDTQGIVDNAPFADQVEARRTGDCATEPAALAHR